MLCGFFSLIPLGVSPDLKLYSARRPPDALCKSVKSVGHFLSSRKTFGIRFQNSE